MKWLSEPKKTPFEIPLRDPTIKKTPFWMTDKGLNVRLKDFSEMVVIRTYNRALQVYGKEAKVAGFTYIKYNRVYDCPICWPYDGRSYRAGQFMPYIPRHCNCQCGFDCRGVVLPEMDANFMLVFDRPHLFFMKVN